MAKPTNVLDDRKERIETLEGLLGEMRKEIALRRDQKHESEELANFAMRERDEARKQFADLKERLLKAETEIARLNGYLERVREDDIVADPLVTVGDTERDAQLVPKRRLQMRFDPDPRDMRFDGQGGIYGRTETSKPKHWVNY